MWVCVDYNPDTVKPQTIEVPIQGMDCAECTRHVQHAIAALPGVQGVEVYLASEKAVVRLDPKQVDLPAIRRAVEGAGYKAPERLERGQATLETTGVGRRLSLLLAGLFILILVGVVLGEWLGWFEWLNERLPWWAGLGLVLALGYPVLRNVVRATLKGQVLSHTLMTLGVVAALLVQEWMTALMVVFFMRVGDFVERFTAGRARQAVGELARMAPQTARVEREGNEIELPAEQVGPGEIVIVRPGEVIPVDGEVVGGAAAVNQAAITGEALPVEAGPGTQVYAASLAISGSLRVRTQRSGRATVFGQVIHLVEEAELQKAPVERMADKFSAYYLPVVAGVAALTFAIGRDPLATAAVLVVACSCAFALATPLAMLASVGAAARRGVMIKGGKYLELLARAEVVLIDKTGTLTLGRPEIADRWVVDPVLFDEQQILSYAASAERYSEHPLAEAVREAARGRGLALGEPEQFEAIPGRGVRAVVNGRLVEVGKEEMGSLTMTEQARQWKAAQEGLGRSVLLVRVDGELTGMLAAADRLRDEAPAAIEELRALGIEQIELLTGDNEGAAAELAGRLGVDYRAGLLPQDKIQIVKDYQARGKVVVMVGDGINDAPALTQAEAGIAMGAAGSDLAIEAAHVALMREDWRLVPDLLRIARRTMGVVRGNIAFTAVYNLAGLSLAAFGLLPPVLAAAAQSLPDLIILGNSARLIRQK